MCDAIPLRPGGSGAPHVGRPPPAGLSPTCEGGLWNPGPQPDALRQRRPTGRHGKGKENAPGCRCGGGRGPARRGEPVRAGRMLAPDVSRVGVRGRAQSRPGPRVHAPQSRGRPGPLRPRGPPGAPAGEARAARGDDRPARAGGLLNQPSPRGHGRAGLRPRGTEDSRRDRRRAAPRREGAHAPARTRRAPPGLGRRRRARRAPDRGVHREGGAGRPDPHDRGSPRALARGGRRPGQPDVRARPRRPDRLHVRHEPRPAREPDAAHGGRPASRRAGRPHPPARHAPRRGHGHAGKGRLRVPAVPPGDAPGRVRGQSQLRARVRGGVARDRGAGARLRARARPPAARR